MYIRLVVKFLSSLLILSLAACGPIYTTEYEIVPPPTEFGAMCANNCLLSKTSCENYCLDKANQSRLIRSLEQQNRDLRKINQGTKLSDDFNFGFNDNDQCVKRCMVDYHTCHVNCGGMVIPHTRTTTY
ncbi:hypothetical protein [Candidatus Tisiphia endosymbiont of Nemotelus uliginosus]|uniref:hypothetical protein n=1 Tax=Candidatus Tisiphia endosymbiont of Nemotelus uliginosus TaxID=3077926 RepID=UPI0035C92FB2